MKILPIHYKISKPVKSYKEIRSEAKELMDFVWRGEFKGLWNKAYAIAHCQVSETPYAFFVVAMEHINSKMFDDQVIINPQILEAPTMIKIKHGNEMVDIPNAIDYDEPCMSFPFRQPKRITRYNEIKVRYQVHRFIGFKTVTRKLSGLASEIFQHEYDHIQGKNIYFESEHPVKWWELIGKDRPLSDGSPDKFDATGLTPAVEKPVSK